MNPTSIATPADSGVSIRATKVSGPGIGIGGTKNTEAGWAEVRTRRNALLAASDWTQIPDAPLGPEHRAAWAAYRQALRDVTEAGHVGRVSWPTPPAKGAPPSPAENV